jgi:phage FluMu protein Com
MPITLNCPCGKILRVADQHAGKRVKCPVCQAVSTVPAPEPEPEFEIIEPAPRATPARPVARPRLDDDEEEGGSYGLARPGGGRAAVRAEEGEDSPGTYGLSKGGASGGRGEDEGPRDKPLPDFRLGSGQRDKKRKKKK